MTKEEKKEFRIAMRKSNQEHFRMLNDASFFYFGIEMGSQFYFEQTIALTPGFESWSRKHQHHNFFTSTRFFTGYSLRDHHFEICLGGIRVEAVVNSPYSIDEEMSISTYFTPLVRYYYRIPFKSSRFRLLVGAELGPGFRFPSPVPILFWPGEQPYPFTRKYANRVIGIAGGSLRLDIRLAPWFTLFFQETINGAFSPHFKYTFNPNPPDQTPSSDYAYRVFNIMSNIGLKFDFFHKK